MTCGTPESVGALPLTAKPLGSTISPLATPSSSSAPPSVMMTAPVMTTSKAKVYLADSHPLAAGVLGSIPPSAIWRAATGVPLRWEPGRAGHWELWQTSLHNPEFAEYITLCGAKGERVTAPEDIWPAFERALAYNGPALLELITDAELI